MFRAMRRSGQQLTGEEAEAILREGTAGVLAVAGDDGYPYAVPVNYVYDAGKIWVHGARHGHRTDAVRRCDRVSFCVVAQDTVVPEELTTYFRSAIAFGRARILEDPEEIRCACRRLGLRFLPDPARVDAEIAREAQALGCLEITVEHLTGKQAIELVRRPGDGAPAGPASPG